MSTCFVGAESGDIKIDDTVVIYVQGPIVLCTTAGAKLRGASLMIIAVDGVVSRLDMTITLEADITNDFTKTAPSIEIMRLTHGRSVDVAIEVLGMQMNFESYYVH